jgi:hypothetical protein
VDRVVSYAKFKQSEQLKRKGGAKRTKLTGISKLDDANYAGGAKGKDCTLILTEGDSAKSLAIAGLSVIGRDYYGVFPLKGKLLNVREASHSQIMKNEEIESICKILGLRHGAVYEDTKTLRYGHLVIMADQDHDGSHIKGLLINFIHHFWPSLLGVPGFLQQFITPIVKATKGKTSVKTFFTMPECVEKRPLLLLSNGALAGYCCFCCRCFRYHLRPPAATTTTTITTSHSLVPPLSQVRGVEGRPQRRQGVDDQVLQGSRDLDGGGRQGVLQRPRHPPHRLRAHDR